MRGVVISDVVILSMLLLFAGCWEEVHYVPTMPRVAPEAVELSANETENISVEPAPEINSTEKATAQPTTDELFGGEPVVVEESPDEGSPPVVEDDSEAISESQPETAEPAVSDPVVIEKPEAVVEEATEDIFATDKELLPEESATQVEVLRPSRTALATWRMSSWWSLAAAIYAKGQGADRYADLLKQATSAAETLGAALPEFPTSDPNELESTVIRFLLGSGSEQLADSLSEEFPLQYTALAELAIKTNTMLLVYTPKSQQLGPLVAEIRQVAQDSGLPPKIWSEFVDMLEQRAPFADVKRQILAMHTSVGDYLAGEGE